MKKAAVSSLLIAVALVAFAVVAEAQQPGKMPRIGFLASGSPYSFASQTEAFRLGLRELGYVEGQNIGIEYRDAEGRQERFPDLLAELVRLKVDIIVVSGDRGDPRRAEIAKQLSELCSMLDRFAATIH
jgi:ABC-type uncharacterized transport system substrate-binding protein